MDQLILHLQASLVDVNEWIPKGTMLQLYSRPKTTNLDKVCSYDLTLLIGYRKSLNNTKFFPDGVSSRYVLHVYINVYVYVYVYVHMHVHVNVLVYIHSPRSLIVGILIFQLFKTMD